MEAVATIMERLDVLPPDTTPCIFTAPHNIGLRRDGESNRIQHPPPPPPPPPPPAPPPTPPPPPTSGEKDHKQEDWTSFLAREFADASGGGALSWSRREIERSKEYDSHHHSSTTTTTTTAAAPASPNSPTHHRLQVHPLLVDRSA